MKLTEAMQAVAAASTRTRHEHVHGRVQLEEARRRAGVDAPDHSEWQATLPPETASLWLALREVSDPELPISLVDLGLIYRIEHAGSHVTVDCTFTATACPCMAFIKEDIRDRLLQEPNVDTVEVRDVWDPPWTVERMTPEGRAILRGCGVAA